jgi:hypothetical protein
MNFKAENNDWHHGFQMTFDNKCTISVQFNGRSYCDAGKTTAEVAAWNNDNDWMKWNGNNWDVLANKETYVMASCTPDNIATMISELVKIK